MSDRSAGGTSGDASAGGTAADRGADADGGAADPGPDGAGIEVSVVLPAYNEAATIEETVSRTLETLADFLPAGAFEVIVAEDGCSDRTPEIADSLAAADDRVRHVHSDDRLGRGRALERAFRAARGSTLAYLDTDMATDMRHVEELVESVRSGEYDFATGSRWIEGHEADRPAKRGVPSKWYNRFVRWFLRSELRDHQCGFKAFDRAALFDVLDSVEDEHWFWDTEVLVRAQRAGYRVREFPVDWTPMGDSKVDLVRDVFGMGSQVVRTYWDLSVSPRVNRRTTMAAGTLLTVLAVLLMTQYIDFSRVLAEMAGADPVLVGAGAAVYVLSWPLRGLRYRDILAEIGYHERVGFLTGAVFISQTGNLVFPARAGDAVRAYVVKTRRGVPYPSGVASLAVERVFDLLTITALAGTVLVGLAATGNVGELAAGLFGADGRRAASGQVGVAVAAGVGLAAVLAVLAIVASARSERNYARALVSRVSGDRYLSADDYAEVVAGVLERFAGDVQTVAGDGTAFARVGTASVLVWSLDVLTAALVLAAFSPGVGTVQLLAISFFAVSVGNLAKVLPLSPGGVGLYEGVFSVLAVALGIGPEVAIGAAIVDHAVKNAVTVAGGVASMLALNVSLTTAVEGAREAEARAGADAGADPEADPDPDPEAVAVDD